MTGADTDSPMAAGPGALLEAAREQAGLSLTQAAEQLHLDVATVRAIEAGRFEVLGAAVYARGHLRRYAELLGLPVTEVEKAFLQQHPARSAPDLRHGAGLLQKGDAGGGAIRPGTAAVGAVLLVVVGIVLWAKRVPRRPVPVAATIAESGTPARAAASHAAAAPKTPLTPTAPATPAATAPVPTTPTMPAVTSVAPITGEGGLFAVPLTPRLPVVAAGAAVENLTGRPMALWDATADSAARRSPVDGGGGVIEAPPVRAPENASSRAPARTTRP